MFPNTRWTELARATMSGDAHGRHALETLCRNYWEPVKCFVIQRGWSPDEAPDLTQAFFLYLMEKGLLHSADRQKGRFRCFLQGVLNHFLLAERQRRQAQKRGGAMQREELHDDTAATEADAGLAFDREWAQAVVVSSFRRVEEECRAKRGQEFYQVIAVFIGGQGAIVSHEEASAKLGIGVEKFRNEIFTWRGKFREELRNEVRHSVSAPHEVDEELRYLWKLLTSI